MAATDMKRSYYEDIQPLRGGPAKVWFLVLLVVLVAAPFVVKSYYVYVISLMAVNVIVALGMNLLVGNTGHISLGHAGFVAIGAYTTVMLMAHPLIPFPVALLAGGILAAGFGFVLGIPALRLEGPYLAIATLGFGIAVTITIGRMSMFGGHMGLIVPKPVLAGIDFSGDRALYYLVTGIALLMGFAMRNILKSRLGRAFHAIRDSDIAASTLGVNVARYKTLSFAISAFYAGIAGGLWAFVLGFINPGLFSFVLSILFLATVVVGGLGTVLGSVLGAIVITFLNLQAESIQFIPVIGDAISWISANFMSMSGMPNVSWVITGLILILIVIFEPLGLYGIWIRIKIYWKTWPF
jgi:branched-chain amino acid transport system permease protein